MKQKPIIITLICTNIFITILGIMSTIFGYRWGYCASFDEKVGASECKPSRKWMY